MPATPTKGKGRKGRTPEKSLSFHGKLPSAEVFEARIRRPKTEPELLGRKLEGALKLNDVRPAVQKLTKLLLNVTISGTVGAVQVIVSPESSVSDLIAAALKQYAKEGRRPVIHSDAAMFDLHYSQFSLESLDRDEKLIALGSRKFFLCPRKTKVDGADSLCNGAVSVTTSCCKEAEKGSKGGFAWLKFVDFLGH